MDGSQLGTAADRDADLVRSRDTSIPQHPVSKTEVSAKSMQSHCRLNAHETRRKSARTEGAEAWEAW
jgi:hypothetical protein